ncbi:MAG: PII-like signaling protein [Methylophagaceae bacterium]
MLQGIIGMGTDGEKHTASLLDLSSELPIIIEFFDTPERIDTNLNDLQTIAKADHIVSWPARVGK